VNLLLIGQGKWSEKISKSIASGLPTVSTSIISARKFLSEPEIVENCIIDIVWITSRPSMQSQIVSLLADFPGIVIVEKPLGLSLSDFEILENSRIHSEGRLRLSRPWNYSQVWQLFRRDFPKGINYLDISRGGPDHGSTIPLHVDWFPHDVFLLTNLFTESMLNCEILQDKMESDLLEIKFIVEDIDVMINFRAGKLSLERVATWKVVDYEGRITKIDFSQNQITLPNGDYMKVPPSPDSICKMLTEINVVKKSDVDLDLAVQNWFSKKIFGLS